MKQSGLESLDYGIKEEQKFYCVKISEGCRRLRYAAASVTLLLLAFGSGCVHKGAFSDSPVLAGVEDASLAVIPSPDQISVPEGFEPHLIFRTASTALGAPYARGGSSLRGFDCSGFVQWTYKHVGVTLPRTAREQAVVGVAVAKEDLRMGDIVAFRHPKRGYHTGIYMGDGKFIHSPRRRKTVRYSSLTEPYFSRTYLGARRVLPTDGDKALPKNVSQNRPAGSEGGASLAAKSDSAD